ncbi:Rpp4C4, putative [Medicago truncatula]|uniref:Rpp4C4, putative n=1 Tax=Medicago truncatula TaxID=3880 RepID=A0A072VFU9_MEDTR|nr:Rpp4C4, putative [Medicago truncatula]
MYIQTDEENHWEGDLNRTIKKMFFDKVAFGKFKYLALSDYPELKDVWYGQLHHNVFCNLKHLVVERCDFLSHILFPLNVMQLLQTLEELEVKDCDSLEAVFDVKDLQQPYSVDENKDMVFEQALFCIEKLSPNLEELVVNGTDMLGILNGYCQENIFHKVKLLRLQCFDETPTIFLNDFHTIFLSLETFQVRNSSFATLFPTKGTTDHLSMQLSKQIRKLWLFELEKLKHVWQMLDVVKIDEEKAEENIVFENLEYLKFTSLSSLRSFFYGKQTFIFPSLLFFIVKGCPQMKIFSSALIVAPYLATIEVEEENMRWKGDLNTTIEQMFIEKEVSHFN